MAKYLVTGGAGFIGSNLVAHLVSQGEQVRVLDNFATGRAQNLAALHGKFELYEGDIRSEADCARAAEGIDYVLHQAALGSVPRSLADPLATHEVNLTGTLNMLVAARDAGVKRVVFASSSSVYGDQEVEYKHEDLPLLPRSPYAASKAAGEHYLRAFHESFGLETVALRYFNVFGPHQDPDSPYSAVVPLFIRALLNGESPTIHGDGQQARDFTYVENVVSANVLAATGDYVPAGQAYNIACGSATSVIDLALHLAALVNSSLPLTYAPGRVGDVARSLACTKRAAAQLGYHAAIPFIKGIGKTLNWYQNQPGLR